MNEAGFWSRWVRPALNRPPEWIAKKMSPPPKGFPDVLYNLEGSVGLIELKYIGEFPARPITPLTMDYRADQRAHLREWVRARGSGFLLLGVEDFWYLLPHDTDDRRPRGYYKRLAYAWGPLATLRTHLPAYLLRP